MYICMYTRNMEPCCWQFLKPLQYHLEPLPLKNRQVRRAFRVQGALQLGSFANLLLRGLKSRLSQISKRFLVASCGMRDRGCCNVDRCTVQQSPSRRIGGARVDLSTALNIRHFSRSRGPHPWSLCEPADVFGVAASHIRHGTTVRIEIIEAPRSERRPKGQRLTHKEQATSHRELAS